MNIARTSSLHTYGTRGTGGVIHYCTRAGVAWCGRLVFWGCEITTTLPGTARLCNRCLKEAERMR